MMHGYYRAARLNRCMRISRFPLRSAQAARMQPQACRVRPGVLRRALGLSSAPVPSPSPRYIMARTRNPKSPRKTPRAPAGWRKVTMDLPRDTAKKLHLLAIERETTMGRLAAPAIKSLLAGSYFVDLAGGPVAIAEGTSELREERQAS
jgi:hypothetical protein